MQLALTVPLFVVIYRRRAWAGHLFSAFVIAGDTLLNLYIVDKYKLRAGPLAEENWYLFAYMFQKPWTKFGSLIVGIAAAWLYVELLNYRKLEYDDLRAQFYPKLNWCVKCKPLHHLLFLGGAVVVLTNLLIGHSAIASPYSWSLG